MPGFENVEIMLRSSLFALRSSLFALRSSLFALRASLLARNNNSDYIIHIMGKFIDHLFRKAGRTYGTGKWIITALAGPEDEAVRAEYALGAYLAKSLREQAAASGNTEKSAFVRELGEKLAARLKRQLHRFTFELLDSREVNAFALPGGFIFVHDGLLDFCGMREEEIAFVLGHEIGHVVNGHALDRMVANSLIKIISNLGPAGITRQTLGKLLSSTYSQDQELEADIFGSRIIAAAGYDHEAASAFMERMQQRPGSEGGLFGKYFSTHPPHGVRVENLQRYWRDKS